jgi:hypothetical protein
MARYCLVVLVLVLSLGCDKASSKSGAAPASGQGERRPEIDEFFVKWLNSHGHADVTVDSNGVGIPNNATRLQASLYGSKKTNSGAILVEVEFNIQLPTQGKIVEFLAGMGETEDKAIQDALANFTLTTFHVIYKSFMNADDSHISMTTIPVGGKDREVVAGDILMRGTITDQNFDSGELRKQVLGVLKDIPLGPGPHWTKIVYSQNEGKPMTVAVTMDNGEHADFQNRIMQLKWPNQQGFYMAKQFIVIK